MAEVLHHRLGAGHEERPAVAREAPATPAAIEGRGGRGQLRAWIAAVAVVVVAAVAVALAQRGSEVQVWLWGAGEPLSLEALATEVETLRSQLADQSNGRGEVKTLAARVEAFEAERSSSEGVVKALTAEVEALRSQLVKERGRRYELEERVTEVEALHSQLAEETRRREELKALVQHIQLEVKALQPEHESANDPPARISSKMRPVKVPALWTEQFRCVG